MALSDYQNDPNSTTQMPTNKEEELARKKALATLLEEKIYKAKSGESAIDEGDIAESKRLGISGSALTNFVNKAYQNRDTGVANTYYQPTATAQAPAESRFVTPEQVSGFFNKVEANKEQAAPPPVGILSGLDELAAMQNRPFGTNTATSQAARSIGPESSKYLRAAKRLERLGFKGAAEQQADKAGDIMATESGVTSQEQMTRLAQQKLEGGKLLKLKQDADRQQYLNNLEMIRQNSKALSAGQPLPYAIQ